MRKGNFEPLTFVESKFDVVFPIMIVEIFFNSLGAAKPYSLTVDKVTLEWTVGVDHHVPKTIFKFRKYAIPNWNKKEL